MIGLKNKKNKSFKKIYNKILIDNTGKNLTVQ